MSIAAIITPVPTISLNGTDRKELLLANRHLANAVLNAIDALEGAVPHARDYLNRLEDLQAAMQIHKARVAVLDGMYRALELEAIDLSNA